MKKHTPRVTPSPRRGWAPMALVLATLPMVIYADVPHTFEAKTVISSSQVNANFEDLDGRIGVYERAISVDGSGNVGVGTESHPGILSVLQSSPQDNVIVGQKDQDTTIGTDTGGWLQLRNLDTTDDNFALIAFASSDSKGSPKNMAEIAGVFTSHAANSYSGDLAFLTSSSSLPPSEKMRVTSIGAVGIGTSAPAARLHVSGANPSILVQNSGEADIHFQDTSSNQIWEVGTNSLGWYVYDQAGASKPALLVKKTSGNIGIGTNTPSQKLHVVGNVTADDYLSNSDRRLKTDILPLQSALEQVQCLEGVSYRWESPEASQDLQVGLIAQDVEACMPEVVTTDPTGYKSVSYARLVAPLIEAVKEQQHTISVLETRDSTQQQQITALEARLARLEALLQSAR